MLQLACKTKRKNEPNHRQGSHSFASNSMTFHEFFRGLFTFSITLCLAVTFKSVQNSPCFRVFFDYNTQTLWCPPKCVPFSMFNYSTLFYIVLALSFAVTNVTNKK